MSQKDLAYMLGFSVKHINTLISGVNYHKGENQTGKFKRKNHECLMLAYALNPTPAFIEMMHLDEDDEVKWALTLKDCNGIADVMLKMEADNKHWLDDFIAMDEVPDIDE